MTFCAQSLRRHGTQAPVGSTAGASNLNQVSSFLYATDDGAAAVEAAGYFNAARGLLTTGSIIQAVMAVAGGAPVGKNYVVTAAPASGSVAVALASDAGSSGLSLSATSFAAYAPAGTAIGTFSGAAPASVSPNDGTVAISRDKTRLVVGLSASAAGTKTYTFTDAAGNQTAIPITIAAASARTTLTQAPTGLDLRPVLTVKQTIGNGASVTSCLMNSEQAYVKRYAPTGTGFSTPVVALSQFFVNAVQPADNMAEEPNEYTWQHDILIEYPIGATP